MKLEDSWETCVHVGGQEVGAYGAREEGGVEGMSSWAEHVVDPERERAAGACVVHCRDALAHAAWLR